ncbi:MAG: protein kinase [Planctomycetes bacterium]|nr:protein kinase [Planctomycetota bacterium]
MAAQPHDCPSHTALEELAADQPASEALQAHVASCPACRAAIERIRADNRFLSGFALGGTLPGSKPTVEPFADLKIPGYELLGEVHRGGQGVVYRAMQLSTKRPVAIKVMKQGPFATLADRARFDREIEILGRLDHPNIVTVHDAGVAGGNQYFVMDFVDGPPLDVFVYARRRAGGVEDSHWLREGVLDEVISMFAVVCDAVHAAHLRGVIHRDIKPSNIRVDAEGRPHVLDFGLAKSTDAEPDSAMTRTGQFVGSLPWASPEQVEGASDRIDLRSDVYSLGACLYQLLTGAPPFDIGSNLKSALDSILLRDPPPPSSVVPFELRQHIDDELDTIVLRCLAKDGERRYQSAGDLARDLRRYLANEPIEAKRDSVMYFLRKTLRRYRWRVATAAAMLILLVVFAVVMAFLYRRSTQLEREAFQSAKSLAELLSRSNIENGRMAGLLGNVPQAENLLWRELLGTHATAERESHLHVPPGPPEAAWALWELYRRLPCLATIRNIGEISLICTLADDGRSTWVVNLDGLARRIDSSGNVLDQQQLGNGVGRWAPTLTADGRLGLAVDSVGVSIWNRKLNSWKSIPLSPAPQPLIGTTDIARSGAIFAAVVGAEVVVYRTDDVSLIARFADPAAVYTAVAISHDESRVAVRQESGSLRVFDIASGRLLCDSRSPPPAQPPSHTGGQLAFSRDGRFVADMWLTLPGRIWDISRDPPVAVELSERLGISRPSSLSHDGRKLAVGDLGGTVRIFDAATGQRISSFTGHVGRIRAVAFTDDGRRLWTCGEEAVRLWEAHPDEGVWTLHLPDTPLHSVAVCPQGDWMVAGGMHGGLHRIDRASRALVSEVLAEGTTISSVAVSPDGAWIAAGTYGNAAYLKPADGDDGLRRLDHPNRVSNVCFSPDSRWLATSADDAVIRLWRVEDGGLVREFRGPETRIPQIAFDNAGVLLAAAVRDGTLRVWGVDTGVCLVTAPAEKNALRSVRFSPDSRQIIVGGDDRALKVWDLRENRYIASMEGHNQEIFCLGLSPDGTILASGDSGGTIRLWHLPTRRPLATLDGHTGSIMSLSFADDGSTLLSASLDETLRTWDLTYYRRHIAGQIEAQLSALPDNIGDEDTVSKWRAWAEENKVKP